MPCRPQNPVFEQSPCPLPRPAATAGCSPHRPLLSRAIPHWWGEAVVCGFGAAALPKARGLLAGVQSTSSLEQFGRAAAALGTGSQAPRRVRGGRLEELLPPAMWNLTLI